MNILDRMRASAIPFLVVLSLIAPAAKAHGRDADPGAGPVSLVQAVRTALTNAREVRLSDQDIRITSLGLVEARAGRLPRVDASADFTAMSQPQAAFIQGREVQIADENILRFRATAEQTLYDFGRTVAVVRQAESRVASAETQGTLARERQALDAISAFLAAKRAEEIRVVSDESLATARAHRKEAQDLYDQGVVAMNDVLAADVAVANAEATLITAENQVEMARSRLALRMGYSGDRAVVPAPGDFPRPEDPPAPLSEDLRAALDKRNELTVQSAFIREGEAAAAAADAAFAPAFFGQGGYSYEANDFNPHKSVFSLVVGGRLNLFSGYADDAARRAARLTVDRRREALGQLQDAIALEVKGAHLAVIEADKRKAVAGVAVGRAEENLRIQNDRYQEGLAISTEALDAQTLLTRAKVDLRNAVYDLFEARYRLLAARGDLLEFLMPLLTR